MKESRSFRIILLSAGCIFFILSLVIYLIDLNEYRQRTLTYPTGTALNGVPLGGLNREQALERLVLVFSQPVELIYDSARMQFDPLELGFQADYEASLNDLEAKLQQGQYWQHLWGKEAVEPAAGKLQIRLDRDILYEFFLSELSPRYEVAATEPIPVVTTTHFSPGEPGSQLDMEAAADLVEYSLQSSSNRVIELPIIQTPPLPLNLDNLLIFLEQAVALEGFDDLIEIYVEDLAGDKDFHLALRDNQKVTPDVAFSAASTIKIPIMLSIFNRSDEPTDQDMLSLMRRMIILSENPPADALMSRYIDQDRGPLTVSDDLKQMGYENTFLAGYFAVGSPVLALYKTPANTRTDIYLDPDIYNQTVPSEIGDLLTQIYTCANPETGSSKISRSFGGAVSQNECRTILDLLSQNKIGLLMEAGLPPQASAAHKHGWTSELDGLLHSMSDAGIVSTPGGDYVLVIFVHTPEQLVFYDGNWLFAKLSQTIYNAFNIDDQTYWWIE